MPSDREARRDAYVAKARAELAGLASRGVCMSGNSFSSVLFVKGRLNVGEKDGRPLLSGKDGTALRKSLEALGYAPEDWRRCRARLTPASRCLRKRCAAP